MTYTINISDVERYISYLKSNYDLQYLSNYRDFLWFESNKYTSTSEYFGELMLFIRTLLDVEELQNERERLVDLEEKICALFK